jgi:hypothetical protein
MKHYRALAVMLIILAVVAASPAVSKAAPRPQTFSASLTPVGGLVQYLPAGKSDWQTVNQVTLINEGDQIRTGEGGIAKLNVVTGTQVDIFPSTIVALNTLSLGSDNSGMKFNMLQLQGMTQVNVSQTIKAGDSLSVSTPTFTANIRGTKFTTGVASDGSAIAFTEEGTIVLRGANGQTIEVGPGSFSASTLNTDNAPTTADQNYLTNNTQVFGMDDAGAQDALKGFLKQFLMDNNSGFVKSFIAGLVGANASTATTEELLAALDGATLDFDAFKTGFVTFVTDYTAEMANNPLAPTTCGNGQQEADETSANCSVDFADIADTLGNNLCDLDQGESIINAPEDCSPLANLLSSAALLQSTSNEEGAGGPNTDGGPGGDNGNNPDGNTGQGTGQGQGAGVGRNPGSIVFFSTTGGAQCVVTATADVNLRSTSTGEVVGVATAGSTFTAVGTNNNGWVIDGGQVSIAQNFTSASAGCP